MPDETKEIINMDPLLGNSSSSKETVSEGDNQTPAVKTEPELIELKVNKEIRRVTQDELKEFGQKYLASEDRFRQAAEVRKNAEPALKFQEAYTRLQAGGYENDPTLDLNSDVETVASYLGMDANEMLDMISGEQMPTNQNTNNNQSNLQRPLDMKSLPSEVKDAVSSVREMNLEKTREKIETDLKNSVDTDTELAKIVSKLASSGNLDNSELNDFKEELFDMALGEVQRQLFMSEQVYGPEMRLSVLQKVRARAKRLGIGKLGKPMSLPPVGSGLVDATLAGELESDQPPKRVSADDGEYPENFAKRLVFALGKSKKTQG